MPRWAKEGRPFDEDSAADWEAAPRWASRCSPRRVVGWRSALPDPRRLKGRGASTLGPGTTLQPCSEALLSKEPCALPDRDVAPDMFATCAVAPFPAELPLASWSTSNCLRGKETTPPPVESEGDTGRGAEQSAQSWLSDKGRVGKSEIMSSAGRSASLSEPHGCSLRRGSLSDGPCAQGA